MGRVEFNLTFVPRWEDIDLIRNAVGLCMSATLKDSDVRDAISMVSSELLENAVKYGVVGPVDYCLFASDSEIAIQVTNSFEPESNMVDNLKETVDWIKQQTSPEDAYAAKLQHLLETPDDSGSGLGLVRIAYEGRCVLSYEVSSSESKVEVAARLQRNDTTPAVHA